MRLDELDRFTSSVGSVAPSTPQRQPVVREVLSQLAGAIDEQANLLKALDGRLACVRRNAPVDQPKDDRSTTGVELADRICELTAIVRDHNRAIERVLGDIEI